MGMHGAGISLAARSKNWPIRRIAPLPALPSLLALLGSSGRLTGSIASAAEPVGMHQAGPDHAQTDSPRSRGDTTPKKSPKGRGQTPAASPTAKAAKVLDVLVSFARALLCCRTGPFLAGLRRAASKAPSVAARVRRRVSSAKASHGRCLKRLAAQVLSRLSSPGLLVASRLLTLCHFILGPPFRASNLHTIGSLGWQQTDPSKACVCTLPSGTSSIGRALLCLPCLTLLHCGTGTLSLCPGPVS